MKLNISEKACKENKVTFAELLILMAASEEEDLIGTIKNLNLRSLLGNSLKDGKTHYFLMYDGAETIKNVIADSLSKQEVGDRDFEALARALKELFPKGKKDGTSQYWAEGVALIVKRLKLFFKKYGKDFTNEQIIEATKSYVESFNGNYSFMRTLKYFIFKEAINAAGEVESTSDLLSYIENKGQANLNNDWTTNLL